MRLYLSSYRMGDEGDRLVAMAGRSARVAVISNALDSVPSEARQAYADKGGFMVQDWFMERGLSVCDLDLREYFDRPAQIDRALSDIDLVWAIGGNAFLLLRAMRQSGLEAVLKRRLADNSLMYGGWSAGACVAGNSLHGVHLMDEPYRLADGYKFEPEWFGLGLVETVIVPHFASDHAESAAADLAVAHLEAAGIPFRTLRDGETIIVDD